MRESEDPFFEPEAWLEFLQIEARGIIRRIHEAEVQLKDIDMGLVDFPAKLNGREVLFAGAWGRIGFATGITCGRDIIAGNPSTASNRMSRKKAFRPWRKALLYR